MPRSQKKQWNHRANTNEWKEIYEVQTKKSLKWEIFADMADDAQHPVERRSEDKWIQQENNVWLKI